MFKKGDIVHRVGAVAPSMSRTYGVEVGGHYEVETRSADGWLTLKNVLGVWGESEFVLSERKSTATASDSYNTKSALKQQTGGNHYKGMKIQPVEFIHANNIGYMEGNVIKYITRWQLKNGLEDLNKAKHYIELLIEMEKTNGTR